MTKSYKKLKESPQTNINRSDLNPDERTELRAIRVDGLEGRHVSNPTGDFVTIYYLSGDERAAAEEFVAEHHDLLQEIDFSKKDRLQTSMSREMYDLILDELGARERTVYETVVLEERPDGAQWLIDRRKYENNPNRRYTVGETGSAHIPSDTSVTDVYDRADTIISEDDLAGTDIEGDIRQVLDYYRVSEQFECLPITTNDSKLAVKKIE